MCFLGIVEKKQERPFHSVEDNQFSRSLASMPYECIEKIGSYLKIPEKNVKNLLNQYYYVKLNEAWDKLKNNLLIHPITHSYLEKIPAHLTPEKKFKVLYERMLKDAVSLNIEKTPSMFARTTTTPKLFIPTNSKDRIFDPQLYHELASEMENVSLQRVWGRIRLHMPNPIASAQASADAIRRCMQEQANLAAIEEMGVLDLSNMNLGRLPQEIQLFSGLTNIQAENSNLFILDENVYLHFPQLAVLNFAKNQLHELPENLLLGCERLEVVDFSYNQLCELPKELLEDCNRLQVADFSNNKLRKLSAIFFSNCRQLQSAIFNNNLLKRVPETFFQHCPNIENILFQNNQINRISQLLLPGHNQLKHIDFSSNQLDDVPEKMLENCRSIEEVYFNNNMLTNVSNNFFPDCPNLHIANFSNNSGFVAQERLFRNCPKMQTKMHRFARSNYRFKQWLDPTKLNRRIGWVAKTSLENFYRAIPLINGGLIGLATYKKGSEESSNEYSSLCLQRATLQNVSIGIFCSAIAVHALPLLSRKIQRITQNLDSAFNNT